LNRFFCIRVVANFREAESPRLPGKTIPQKRQRIRLHSDFRKQRRYLLFCSLERQISHVQFLHGRSPYAPGSAEAQNTRLKRQDLGRTRPCAGWPHPAEASAPAAQEHLAAN
jgi:hypothetical protein